MLLGFAELEPFGGRQDDYRAGVVAAAVYRAAGAKVDEEDLFPSLGDGAVRVRRRQTPQEMRDVFKAIALASGGPSAVVKRS